MKNTKAFTLVELLIVIIVLGVLVSIVLPKFGDSTEEAKASASLAMLQTIRQQINLARIQHDEYYPALGNGGANWDILLNKTEPSSSPQGTYPPANGSDNDVGPYLNKRPNNPFEDSDSIAPIGQATPGVGFVYDQSTGTIKVVISQKQFETLDLDPQDFEYY